MTAPKHLYLETFGCQMNVNDSERITGMLKGLGYVKTTDAAEADLVILNTCSVRAKAEKKVYDYLGRYKNRKKEQESFILGVGGCVAQQEGERLLAKVPYLDLVFGTHNIHLLPEMVRAAERGERPGAEVSFIEAETRLDLFPAADASGPTAFVTIMQGCDNFCTYCIVPYVRGREISRRSSEILDEVRGLAARGVREVTLLGQNVNSYGRAGDGDLDFAGLIRLVAEVDGIERIRFTTSHPKDISPVLVQCFAEVEKLCGHIHLPAQSGSDEILRRMNRGYTRRDYIEKVEELRRARPGIFITGDIIVGFPGETDEQFEETLSLVEEVGYSDLFSFIYSPRPETAAAGYPDCLTYADKQQRLDRLQKRQRELTFAAHEGLVGSTQTVLVEGTSRLKGQVYGRTSGNRIVNFAGSADLVGRLVMVRVTKAYPNSVLGEVIPDQDIR